MSPSGGVVYRLNDELIGKLLYGEAYRAPNFFEKYVEASNVLYGNPDLQAEKIKTIDLNLTYQKGIYLYQINPFYSKTSDVISRSLTTVDKWTAAPNIPKYGNKGGEKIKGIIFEMKSIPSKVFDYTFNLTYQEGEDIETGGDIDGLEELACNLILNYKVEKSGLNINTRIKYIGDRSLSFGTPGSEQPGTVGNFTVVDLKLLWTEPIPKVDVGLSIFNLFDESYTYPEYIRHRIMETPGGPKRAVYLTLTHRF